jgi:hypothetical protein
VTVGGTLVPDVEISYHGGPLEDGVEVLNYSLLDLPSGGEVKTNVAVAVGIDHQLCAGRDCISIVNAIAEEVVSTIRVLEPLFC